MFGRPIYGIEMGRKIGCQVDAAGDGRLALACPGAPQKNNAAKPGVSKTIKAFIAVRFPGLRVEMGN